MLSWSKRHNFVSFDMPKGTFPSSVLSQAHLKHLEEVKSVWMETFSPPNSQPGSWFVRWSQPKPFSTGQQNSHRLLSDWIFPKTERNLCSAGKSSHVAATLDFRSVRFILQRRRRHMKTEDVRHTCWGRQIEHIRKTMQPVIAAVALLQGRWRPPTNSLLWTSRCWLSLGSLLFIFMLPSETRGPSQQGGSVLPRPLQWAAWPWLNKQPRSSGWLIPSLVGNRVSLNHSAVRRMISEHRSALTAVAGCRS